MIEFTPQEPFTISDKSPDFSREAQSTNKLKKATEEFEAIFVTQLLKSMRSISLGANKEKGFGRDVMLQMADESVSRQLAKSGALGIGDILYKHLAERFDLGESGEEISVPRLGQLQNIRHVARDQTSGVGQFKHQIEKAAADTGLSVELIEAVIRQESGGNPRAISSAGAAGLMQLMPATAVEMGVKNRFDPAENILGGARYLKQQLDRFKDLRLALAAYNAGPASVEQHKGIPPYAETRQYVEKVFSDLSAAR